MLFIVDRINYIIVASYVNNGPSIDEEKDQNLDNGDDLQLYPYTLFRSK